MLGGFGGRICVYDDDCDDEYTISDGGVKSGGL